MTLLGTTSTRIFLAVSVFIIVADTAFIALNSFFASEALDQRFQAWAVDRRATYEILLDETLENMLVLAEIFARDPQLHDLFVSGRDAVVREGGGPGAEQAAIFRHDLLELLQPAWEIATADFDLRQLHFHIGPGSLSFLRVHQPDKFGDRMDNLRFIIVDTIADGHRRSGFELGRVYSGLRGVVPIYPAVNSHEGAPIGAVEVGISYQSLLDKLHRHTDSNFAVLLKTDRVDEAMWEQFRRNMTRLPHEDFVVEAATSDDLAELIAAIPPRLLEDRDQGERAGRFESQDGHWIAVASWPLVDYVGSTHSDSSAPGLVIVYEDVSNQIHAYHHSLLTSVLYAIAAFVALEVFLFLAIRVGTRHLQSSVDSATQSIRSLNAELKVRAETDSLTGLLNRTAFFHAAETTRQFVQRQERRLGIAMIDIDHFKEINDQYGHSVGDQVIKAVAHSIRASVRDGDLVCRYGGEEFLVLMLPPGILSDPSHTNASYAVAERIHGSVKALHIAIDHPDSPLHVTVSVGVTEVRQGETIDHATIRADELLYEAKRGGRDWVSTG